jgi:hypothetical protein
MSKPTKRVAVVMQRRPTSHRWQSVIWEPWSVLESAEPAGAPRLLVDQDGAQQWLHPGFELVLHRDEAEGYYLNVSTESPRVFVLWRMDEQESGLPLQLTASYDEGGRWLDAGHSVDGVPMPPEIYAWVGAYVEENYRPQPKKRVKPRSFLHPKDRVG